MFIWFFVVLFWFFLVIVFSPKIGFWFFSKSSRLYTLPVVQARERHTLRECQENWLLPLLVIEVMVVICYLPLLLLFWWQYDYIIAQCRL